MPELLRCGFTVAFDVELLCFVVWIYFKNKRYHDSVAKLNDRELRRSGRGSFVF